MEVGRRSKILFVTLVALGFGLVQLPPFGSSPLPAPLSWLSSQLGAPRNWRMFAPSPPRLVQLLAILTDHEGKTETRKIYEEEAFARKDLWWNWKLSITRPKIPRAYLQDVVQFVYRRFNSPERPIKKIELVKRITPYRVPGKIVIDPPQLIVMETVEFQ